MPHQMGWVSSGFYGNVLIPQVWILHLNQLCRGGHGMIKCYPTSHDLLLISLLCYLAQKPSLLPNKGWFVVVILHLLNSSAPWLFLGRSEILPLHTWQFSLLWLEVYICPQQITCFYLWLKVFNLYDFNLSHSPAKDRYGPLGASPEEATRMMRGMEHLYFERLRELGLLNQKKRKLRDSSGFPIPEGSPQKRWRRTFYKIM